MTVSDMKPYNSYKKTNQLWLKNIPTHWDAERLGSLFLERRIKVSDQEYKPLSVTKNGILPQLSTAAKSDDGDNRKQVLVGDFVINSRSDRKGSSGLSPLTGSVSLINIVLKPRKTENSRFMHYLLKSYDFVEEYYRKGRGIVADLWTTRFSEMKTSILPVPPREEQDQIVRFLDWKLSKINKLINAKKKQIALLNEQKQAIINKAVTKGLDNTVETIKIKFKYLLTLSSGDALINSKLLEDALYPVFGGGKMLGYSFDFNIDEKNIVIGRVGANCGCITNVIKKSWATDNALIVTPKIKNKEYLLFLLIASNLNTLNEANAQPLITATKVANKLINYSSDEKSQEIIVDMIKKNIIKIDLMILKIKNSIELLSEYKTSLISSVVTGKIDVRDVIVPDCEIEKEIIQETDIEENIDEEEDEKSE
ncbi:MAG: restriction endonuclease subunit S [Treponemataceae bacterium]